MGLIIEDDTLPLPNNEIKLNSKKLGVIKSSIFSYSLQKNISLSYIQKDHRSPDIDLDVTIDNKPYKIRTCLLPFYQPQTAKITLNCYRMKHLNYIRSKMISTNQSLF